MHLQIFGLATEPDWWYVSRVPPGGGKELGRLLAKAVQSPSELQFYFQDKPLEQYQQDELMRLWAKRPAQIIAKPADAALQRPADTYLRLVTTAGPDAGRLFPLTRRNLSVGRGLSRAQVRDPWLSARDFKIRLTSNGPLLTSRAQTPRIWPHGQTLEVGSTHFVLLRGHGNPLDAPQDPGACEIAPNQPPAPPNLLLQIMGAAAPLLIGVVLMVMTGMWYFLLFSGISVIIAAVLITQYRRARSRYIGELHDLLEGTAKKFRQAVFTPHQLMSALAIPEPDSLACDGPQPEFPILNIGSAMQQAKIAHLQDSKRWDRFLFDRITSVLQLRPGHRTIIVGDPATRHPVKNWIVAQLLRHSKATGFGFLVDARHIGGTKIVELYESFIPASEPDQHQVILLTNSPISADEYTTIVDLHRNVIEGTYTATALEPYGISRSTLRTVARELLIEAPRQQSQLERLSLPGEPFKESATREMVTTLGTGAFGMSIDLVREGPHLLITGTTGSGKSELLLTVLVGLTQNYSPCEMSMVLLDFKGGASFNVLAPLPHTMSVETNHVAATSFRSLEAIGAELYRREELFAAHHVADFEAFRKTFPERTLPRLVVAIDELRVLVDQNAEAAGTLARLAATGRSLGFHLIIATQRTQGAVNADIRANVGATIALRTATEHNSWDVLGTADAFHISPKTPGRAYFKAGAETPRMFQTGSYALDDDPLVVLPYDHPSVVSSSQTTNWSRVIEKLRKQALKLPRPQPIILAALDPGVTVASLRERYQIPPVAAPIGLVDDPATCQQYPVALGTAEASTTAIRLASSVAWVGAADSGIEECLPVVAHHVVSSDDYKVLFEGRPLRDVPSGWDKLLHIDDASGDVLRDILEDINAQLTQGVRTTVMLTEWGSWTNALVTGSFQGFEERLIQLMRQFSSILTVYVFGARELAGGRLLAMIPDRFYIPKNSSAEHQLIWPTLRAVPPASARAVLVTADQPHGGLETQLCIG